MNEIPLALPQKPSRLIWWSTIAAILLSAVCARAMQLDKSGLFPSFFLIFLFVFLVCTVVLLAVLLPYWLIKGRPRHISVALCALFAFLLGLPIWIHVLDNARLELAKTSLLREAQKNLAAGQPARQLRRLLDEGWSDFDVLVYDPTDAEADIPSDVAKAKAKEVAGKTQGLVISTPLGGHFYREWTDYGQ